VTSLFISDLHLHPDRPAATSAFKNFLATEARDAKVLYILGDLFEAWFGDDNLCAHDRDVISALAELTQSGTPCFFMHGNRDFMIGPQFAAESGVDILYDPTLIYVGGESVLISHGDFLCTDDVSYQRYRKIVRNPVLQRLAMAMPLQFRAWIGTIIRRKSIASADYKRPEILDVNEDTVRLTLRNYGVEKMIHGHTHRPAIHEFDMNGRAAQRIVLGDWYDHGSVLAWDDAGPKLETRAFSI
jgi:UDP-2,3-diacylglucosamine hydrolase